MNVYDFDHTIYDGDCTLDFWLFCVYKYPKVLRNLPIALGYALLFKLKICSREVFKEKFYRFLRDVPNVQKTVECFWTNKAHKIKANLFKLKSDDVIISASPKFLLSEIAGRLNVKCIASEVDEKTGKLMGPNCRGAEKVNRFREIYGDTIIDEFYSDSQSDRYLAALAKQAYKVSGQCVERWDNY